MNLFRDLSWAVLPPFTVLVLQALRMFFFPDAMHTDIAMHFLGGLSIAWGAFLLWERLRARKAIPSAIPPWIIAWTFFGATLFAGIVWELWEFGMEQLTGWVFQPSIADTMSDLVMDMLGGALFILATWKKRG